MDDARIWEMEAELWHGGAEVYERLIDHDVVMALPEDPFVYSREAAIKAVTNTPRWEQVDFSSQQVIRLICPLLSGPKSMLFWIMKEIGNAIEEAQAGGDHRQVA